MLIVRGLFYGALAATAMAPTAASAGFAASRLPLRQDPDARRDPPQHQHLRAAGPARAAALSPHPHPLRHRRRYRGAQELPVPRGRRLHLRLPGHPRALRQRGAVHHEPPAARSGRLRTAWTRAPTPTTPSTGCSRTCPATTAGSACSASPIPGFLATMAGIHPHPAVKAISPQAPMTDTWMGDDFFHQGAFRLSYGFEYAGSMELSNDQSVPLPIGTWDTYDWYLQLGPLANVDAKYFHGKVPTWEAFVAHPAYDAYWQRRAVQRVLDGARGADTDGGRLVGPGGPLRPARHLPGARARGHGQPELPGDGPLEPRRLAQAGPADAGGGSRHARWRICGTSRRHGSRTTSRTRASSTQPEAYALRCRRQAAGARSTPGRPKRMRRHGASTSTPAAGSPSTRPAPGEAPFDQYVSDPAHPVPYRPRPDRADLRPARLALAHLGNRGPAVRRRPARRGELGLGAADEDILIAGNVTARLVASTTGRRRRLGRSS